MMLKNFTSGKMTFFGKYIKSLRFIYGETLGDMADRLQVGVAELSAYEFGRADVPAFLYERIKDEYRLSDKQVRIMQHGFGVK